MKKLIATVLIAGITGAAFAQGFYLRLGLGYAFPQAGQSLDGTGTPYSGTRNNSTYLQTYNIKNASFSAGFQGNLGVGYFFSEHVGAQLDFWSGLANKKYTFEDENVSLGPVNGNLNTVQQAKSLVVLTPSLVVQSAGDPWNFYARAGVVIPLSTAITQDVVLDGTPSGYQEIDDYTFNIKNSFSLGYSGAVGIQYKANDRVSFWGEMSILSLSEYIKEADFVSFSSNNPSAQSTAGNTKYQKNAVVDSTGAVQPAYSQPFSNVGVNVGVCFRFGNNHSSSKGRKHNDDIDDSNKPFRRH